jgi:tetratricopeptide (TPR) repeat protein
MRVIFAFLILFAVHASACINTYEEDILLMMYRGHPEEIAQTIHTLEAANAKAPSIQSKNDLAVAHIISGKYEQAVTILTNLEKEHPGLSRTASNLGTALELSGNNAEALHWIEEGIARDRDDHQGTEWLHVRILEAKVALEKDPAWLETHSVLDADFGSEIHPQMPSALRVDRLGRPGSLDEIEKAMDYQLRERLKFVAAPDPIVASLYRARADIAYLQKSPLTSDYYLAAIFFGSKDGLTKRRAEQFLIEYPAEDSWSKAVGVGSFRVWLVCTVVAALLLLAAGLAFRHLRKPSNNFLQSTRETHAPEQ